MKRGKKIKVNLHTIIFRICIEPKLCTYLTLCFWWEYIRQKAFFLSYLCFVVEEKVCLFTIQSNPSAI